MLGVQVDTNDAITVYVLMNGKERGVKGVEL